MEKNFQEILDMHDVHGLVWLSAEGKILFESFKKNRIRAGYTSFSWISIIESLGDFQEADLVFAQGRFYVRSTGSNYLLISMNERASRAMVKLSCDIILPELLKAKFGKGIRGFFKR